MLIDIVLYVKTIPWTNKVGFKRCVGTSDTIN